MIKMIFKQLWNQRRQNGWILLELTVITFFIFTTSVGVVRGLADYALPDGYEKENAYALQLKEYEAHMFKYDVKEDKAKDSIFHANFNQLLLAIKGCPEVEAVAVINQHSFPGSGSQTALAMYPEDSTFTPLRTVRYRTYLADGTDFIKAYGLTDAHTGELMQLPERIHEGRKVIVSASFARYMFGTIDVVGKGIGKVHNPSGKDLQEIVGVYQDFKRTDFQVGYPSIFTIDTKMKGQKPFDHFIIYRLKEGVDGNAFEEKVMNEIAPRFANTPTVIQGIESFEESLNWYNDIIGIYNHLRYTAVMLFFVLLCVFLGMTGTFWVRCRARRQEIGLMRSIGASQATITRQFMTEAWMLVTIGFLIAQPLIIHYIHGLEWSVIDLTAHYWQDSKTWLTLATDALIYILMVLIALLGTWFPVKQASKDLPAEALRDE